MQGPAVVYDHGYYGGGGGGEDVEHVTHPTGEWWEISSVTDNRMDHMQSVTCVAFDPWEETIWAGLDSGRVVAYSIPMMERYTAVHALDMPARQIVVDQDAILALDEQQVRCFNRGGAFMLNINLVGLQGPLTSMTWLDAAAGALLIGGGSSLFVADVTTGSLLSTTPLPSGVHAVKRARAIWCGNTDGTVSMIDPRTFRVENTLDAHKGSLIDFDSKGDLLVTCGCSQRNGTLYIDPLVKVYDIRTMRSLAPIAFPTGPSMLRFHPKFYSTVAIVSQNGQFQLCDVQGDPSVSSIQYYQIDSGGDALTAFDIASTGEVMAFGDAGGYVHQWADRDDMQVNMYSVDSELPTLPNFASSSSSNSSQVLTHVDDLSVSLADMGVCTQSADGEEPLLSTWPHAHAYPIGVPRYIDNSLLNQMQVLDFVGYIANPGYERYQGRGQHIGTGYLRPIPGKSAPVGYNMLSTISPVPIRPPKPYRWVEIKHSKLIFDDFEFARYNKTTFAGLENSLPNSYCNGCLQVLYYIKLLRVGMLNHICQKEFCLSCELGFLFHMIGQAAGTMGANVQASNFLRTFRQIPQASALGLFQAPELVETRPLPSLIESFNRFILEQLHRETAIPNTSHTPAGTPPSSVIDTLFGTTTVTTTKCLACKHIHERISRSFQFELSSSVSFSSSSSSSSSTPNNTAPPSPLTFGQAVSLALCRDTPTKAWCEQCSLFQSSHQHKEMLALPHILCLTAAAPNTPGQSQQPWRTSIPLRMHITFDQNTRQLNVNHDANAGEGDEQNIYDLSAVLSHIADPGKKAPKGGHIVAEIRVSNGQWYIFNDFCINATPEQNVPQFDPSWRSPCVLYYTRRTLATLPVPPIVNPITQDVLFAKSPLAREAHSKDNNEPLSSRDEIPKPGDVVAVDAEFVSLGAEETELRSDGTRVIVNPAHFSLARVSVVRGEGARAGTPFIDDYIVTHEPITDYLTRFSGIEMGDLDPSVSTKPLTTLKAVYLKLRYLVDHGVKLVGHGLTKDFRIINIVVPPAQVIDTVELFNIKKQRKISLKFLASFLLNIDIQTETHNSIEDARTALALSRTYNKLVEGGQFEQMIQQIYHVGRVTNWNAEAVPHLTQPPPPPPPPGDV